VFFGENTKYYRAESASGKSYRGIGLRQPNVDFRQSYEGNYVYYTTYTVTLYTVSNGNMDSEPISASDFPA
jgi:hypothetical protein